MDLSLQGHHVGSSSSPTTTAKLRPVASGLSYPQTLLRNGNEDSGTLDAMVVPQGPASNDVHTSDCRPLASDRASTSIQGIPIIRRPNTDDEISLTGTGDNQNRRCVTCNFCLISRKSLISKRCNNPNGRAGRLRCEQCRLWKIKVPG